MCQSLTSFGRWVGAGGATGCRHGVLLTSRKLVDCRWGDFDDGKGVFDAIQLGQTTEFDVLLMLKHDRVVYKRWSGTPNINKLDTSKNPLGPLQQAPSAIMKMF